MLRAFLLGLILLVISSGARAEDYIELRCNEMARYISWSEHIVGWLKLHQMRADQLDLDFEQAAEDAERFRLTCAENPSLTLPQAASLTFPELDDIGTRVAMPASEDARQKHYETMRCRDMTAYPDWSAYVVGALNLGGLGGTRHEINFAKALQDAGRLRRTCENFAELWLHQAAGLTFPQFDQTDLSVDVTASIPTKRRKEIGVESSPAEGED